MVILLLWIMTCYANPNVLANGTDRRGYWQMFRLHCRTYVWLAVFKSLFVWDLVAESPPPWDVIPKPVATLQYTVYVHYFGYHLPCFAFPPSGWAHKVESFQNGMNIHPAVRVVLLITSLWFNPKVNILDCEVPVTSQKNASMYCCLGLSHSFLRSQLWLPRVVLETKVLWFSQPKPAVGAGR